MIHMQDWSPTEGDALNLSKENETELLVGEINQFLSAPPRFEGDIAVVLTMPDSYLRKARAKLNEAIHKVYDRYHQYGVSMLDVLCAMESVVGAEKLAPLVDNDVKLMVASEKGIEISTEELDMVTERLKKGELSFDVQRPQPVQEEPEASEDSAEEQDEDAVFNNMMETMGDEDDDNE